MQTHISIDFISDVYDGYLLPLELLQEGPNDVHSGIVWGYGAEEGGEATLVRQGDGGRCVADLGKDEVMNDIITSGWWSWSGPKM